jgi:hypothetical protein
MLEEASSSKLNNFTDNTYHDKMTGCNRVQLWIHYIHFLFSRYKVRVVCGVWFVLFVVYGMRCVVVCGVSVWSQCGCEHFVSGAVPFEL